MQTPDPFPRTNLLLSLGCIVFALVAVFLWIPMDSGSGLILKVRRQVNIGDALAPTIAATVIGLGGVMVFFQRRAPNAGGISLRNLGALAYLLAICGVSFALMRWTGPVVAWIAGGITGEALDYRLLRDTAPWKYLGFVLGGWVLVSALIGWIEGRITARGLIVGALASLALALLYGVPFDHLLLPPNGDV